ncbi:hypothetical protein D3C85_1275180 [compost metagenome]
MAVPFLEGEGVVQELARGVWQGGLGQHAAPGRVAGVGRRGAGQQLRAHGGERPVRRHKQVGGFRAAGGEAGGHARAMLAQRQEGLARMHGAGAERLPHVTVQSVPGDLRLRHVDAAHVATARDEDAAARRHAEVLGQRRAGKGERVGHIGLQDEAAAAAVERLGRAFEHIHVPAGGAQAERREQAAEGAADDHGARGGGRMHGRQGSGGVFAS